MAYYNKQVLYIQKPGNEFPQQVKCVKLIQNMMDVIELKENEILIKNLYVSIDPVMRVWLTGAKTYYPPLKEDDVMHSFGIARVLHSNNPRFKAGQIIFGNTGIQEYYHVKQETALSLLFPIKPQFQYKQMLNLINNGFAAYFGIDILQLKQGQTCVISTAAGATGILACQIAKIKGCRVIGLTGSQKKCEFLLNVLKIDVAINYKEQNYYQKLKKACNKGIDAYFDNVGEEMLNNVLRIINNNGRIALCGASSSYNNYKERKGVPNIINMVNRRVYMKGFNFAEFMDRFQEAIEFYDNHINKIKDLQMYEQVFQGLDSFDQALQHVFLGNNIGKVLIKIHKDENETDHTLLKQKNISPKL